MRRVFLPLAMAVLAVVATACGSPAGGSGDGGRPDRLRIVTSVAPLTSIVASVAGERGEVRGVVPEGTNSHTFEPAPSVAEVLAEADVIFVNGLSLEEPVADLARQVKKAGARIVALGDRVLPRDQYLYDFSFPESEGRPNPHLWTDPRLARRYSEVVRDTLAQADPAGAEMYSGNQQAFAAGVDALDGAMRQSFSTLDRDRRKLLTYHDSFAYFARTYDWQVIGAIQVKDFQEPSPREVADLIGQVKAERVPAIFGSEVFPSPVLSRIGQEAGVRYVDVLRDDDLPGRPGEAGHSWLGLMRFDYATVVEALGGDPSALEVLVVPPAHDRAVYPQ